MLVQLKNKTWKAGTKNFYEMYQKSINWINKSISAHALLKVIFMASGRETTNIQWWK